MDKTQRTDQEAYQQNLEDEILILKSSQRVLLNLLEIHHDISTDILRGKYGELDLEFYKYLESVMNIHHQVVRDCE